MRNIDKFRGCLAGGAVGDALGYAVEFMSESEIFGAYGPRGITEYELQGGVAQISDDTQMTLFTLNGLLCRDAAARIAPYVDGFYIMTPFQRIDLVCDVIAAVRDLE
jgi:ADP-ribosylglycohydrolase